jgi:hypothetical protein
VLAGSQAFRIGANSASAYLEGSIDEVGFWKRMLESGERAMLYNAGAGRPYSAFGGVCGRMIEEGLFVGDGGAA